MKIFLNITASILATFVLLLSAFYLIEVYDGIFRESGDIGLGLLLFILLPFIAIFTIILCSFYFRLKENHIKPIIFGSITGLLLMNLIEMFWISESVIHTTLMENNAQDTLLLINQIVFGHANSLPMILIVFSFFILRKSSGWLHIKGFTLGAVLGFFVSYFAVLVIRKIDNTLTSFFYIQGYELYILVFGTIISMIAGNIIDGKKNN